jgi:cytochrome oxidase assembly protein ShyY1
VRTFGFLLSRRWILFALAVALLAAGAWWLGQWQFDRLEDRRADNEVVRANENQPPAPVADVLRPGTPVREQDEWRVVSATGEYAVEDTIIVRYRTREGIAGVDVVVPLVTESGASLLVDRGWLRTENAGTADPDDVPEPPTGEVTVTGYVRADGSGDSTAVTERSTRAVSSERIGEALGREVYGGFVELQSESPEPATALEPVELPELDDGPHFFYGLQWWFFGVLAIFGFFYLIYDEWRGGRGPWGSNDGARPRPATPERAPLPQPVAKARRRTWRERLDSGAEDDSEGAQEPAVDREHHARQE